jgi:hypothetical protein
MTLSRIDKNSDGISFLFWPDNNEKTAEIFYALEHREKRPSTQSYFSSPAVYTYYYTQYDYISTKDFTPAAAASYIAMLADPSKSPIANALYPNGTSILKDITLIINTRTVPEESAGPLSPGDVSAASKAPAVNTEIVTQAIQVQDKLNAIQGFVSNLGTGIKNMTTPAIIIAGIVGGLWVFDKLFMGGIDKAVKYKQQFRKLKSS